MLKIKFITAKLLLLIAPLLPAQHDAEENLSQMAANPLADLVSFPFQNNLNMNYWEFNRNTNILNIQPVVPLANGRIITLTVFPILCIPDFGHGWQWRVQEQILLPETIFSKK